MDKISQDILLHQFLEGLYQKIGIEINKLDTEKAKGNKHYELLIREENAKATIADLNKIGGDLYWGILEDLKKKYGVELRSFKKKEKK